MAMVTCPECGASVPSKMSRDAVTRQVKLKALCDCDTAGAAPLAPSPAEETVESFDLGGEEDEETPKKGWSWKN
jgi:hypothetical protein